MEENECFEAFLRLIYFALSKQINEKLSDYYFQVSISDERNSEFKYQIEPQINLFEVY
jgi:hypothetical protein